MFARPQSRRDRRRAARLGLEPLEGRDVPTGLVTVEVLGTASEDGTGSPLFRFTRTGSLEYEALGTAYLGGTATYDTDYYANPYLWFPIGEDTWDVPVTVLDDDIFEGTAAETITVTGIYLSDTGGTYDLDTSGSGPDVMPIEDDDPAPIVTVYRLANAVEGGTSGTFRVTRTGDTSAALTVGYTVADSGSGLATPGADYSALSGSVTFPSGWDAVDVSVSAYDDSTAESDEIVRIVLQESPDYYFGDPMIADLSIRDVQSGVITGFAWGDVDGDGIQGGDEVGLSEVPATLRQYGTLVASTLTDENGRYSFTGVEPGSGYTVEFAAPPFDDDAPFSPKDEGGSDATDSDVDPLTGITSPMSVAANEVVPLDVGFVAQEEREVLINFPEYANSNYTIKLRMTTAGAFTSVVGPLRPTSWVGTDARAFVLSQLTELGWDATEVGALGISVKGKTTPQGLDPVTQIDFDVQLLAAPADTPRPTVIALGGADAVAGAIGAAGQATTPVGWISFPPDSVYRMRIVMVTVGGLEETTASVQVTAMDPADARSIALAVLPPSWVVSCEGTGALAIQGKRLGGGGLDPISKLYFYHSESEASRLPSLMGAGGVEVSRLYGQ